MAVVFQHACQLVQDSGSRQYALILDNINLGRFGVVLFFLISGLVIPFSFRGETPLRNFAISRFFRLYPVYWLSIPVLAVVAVARGMHVDLAMALSNLTMMQALWGGTDIGPGYWTLAYEMLFYFLCAFLFWRGLLGDSRLNAIIVLGCLAIPGLPLAIEIGGGGDRYVSSACFFIALFFLGMLLRRAFVDHCAAARRWSLLLAPLTMVVGVMLGNWHMPAGGNPYLGPLQVSLGHALPVAVFAAVLWLKPNPPKAVMYLGTISYSLYLFQDVGLIFLAKIAPPADWPTGYVVAVIVVSTAIAAVVYRWLEQPMIAIGRRLTHRPAAAAATAPA